MAERNEYRRQSRGRRPENRQGDAIVTALTAQVIVCILLLLVAVLVKKADENRFEQTRRQYSLLVTDPQEGAEILEGLSGMGGSLQRFFASVEALVESLVERFAGGNIPAPPPEAEPPAEEGESRGAEVFDYDYLEPNVVSYTVLRQDVRPAEGDLAASAGEAGEEVVDCKLGQGGRFPVETGGQDFAKLPAPDGATFAAVELSCGIVPPVTGLVTSEFSYREHPVDGEDDFHTGLDIAAPEGRDILAALPGTVAETGVSDTYGHYLVLQHAANLQTFYAHCSELIAGEGMVVRQGERIAKVGSTGVATGPHLHFSVIVEGQFTDPYWVLKDNIRLVD